MRNHWILVLDDPQGSLRELAPRIEALGFPTRLAASLPDAVALLRIRHGRAAAVIPVGLALAELAEIPRLLGSAAGTTGVRTLLAGRQPMPDRCAALRSAGYSLALWEPIHDGTLRYQLNVAVGAPGRDNPRVAPRVPTPLVALVRRPDRETEVGVYNLSATGAYLETPRPSARGARIELDLRLPAGLVTLRATVTHANVPGNLRRKLLPIGMGVHFEGLTKEIQAALNAYLALRAQELKV